MADWNWQNSDEQESVVLPSIRAIAVYTNTKGDIVIRQEGHGHGNDGDDHVVVIPRGHVNAVTKALKAEAAKPFDPSLDE